MQIILLDKVLNLGNLGEVVRVKDGYARNFLIPQGKAKRATKSAMADFEAKRAVLEAAQADKLAAATSVGERLNGLNVQISSKSGVDGRLFGSITNQDVAEALGKQGYSVIKSQVRMVGGALKTIGDHAVEIGLHTDVQVSITVTVVGQAN